MHRVRTDGFILLHEKAGNNGKLENNHAIVLIKTSIITHKIKCSPGCERWGYSQDLAGTSRSTRLCLKHFKTVAEPFLAPFSLWRHIRHPVSCHHVPSHAARRQPSRTPCGQEVPKLQKSTSYCIMCLQYLAMLFSPKLHPALTTNLQKKKKGLPKCSTPLIFCVEVLLFMAVPSNFTIPSVPRLDILSVHYAIGSRIGGQEQNVNKFGWNRIKLTNTHSSIDTWNAQIKKVSWHNDRL